MGYLSLPFYLLLSSFSGWRIFRQWHSPSISCTVCVHQDTALLSHSKSGFFFYLIDAPWNQGELKGWHNTATTHPVLHTKAVHRGEEKKKIKTFLEFLEKSGLVVWKRRQPCPNCLRQS